MDTQVAKHVIQDFNPRSPHGERQAFLVLASCCRNFNPRSPHGERPPCRRRSLSSGRFQPTLPARGATWDDISEAYDAYISTHAPRTGSDALTICPVCNAVIFQPTLPARGATIHFGTPVHPHSHFNPRSPHGERPMHDGGCGDYVGISTHAPRTGSDPSSYS